MIKIILEKELKKVLNNDQKLNKLEHNIFDHYDKIFKL